MMQDTKVGADDARQADQHVTVKAAIERQVNADIAEQATAPSPDGHSKLDSVAGAMRANAVNQAARGERALGQARTAARGSQYLDYAFSLVYTLLAIRLVLSLIAARADSGFVRFIGTLTAPFYTPFRGIVPSPSAEGGYTLVAPILVAIVAYAILHGMITAALRMVGRRKTEV